MGGDRERCLKAGRDGYLIKPIQPATLLEAIERLHLVCGGRSKSTRKIVLDRAALVDRVDGDVQLLGGITKLFLQECVPLMASAPAAMKTGNTHHLTYALPPLP